MVGEHFNFPQFSSTLSFSTTSNETSGYFAPICVDLHDVNNIGVVEERKKILTSGSKNYFECQVYDVWCKTIDEAVLNGDITFLFQTSDINNNNINNNSSINNNTNAMMMMEGGTSRQERLLALVAYKFRMNEIPIICSKSICETLVVLKNNNKNNISNNVSQQQQQIVVPLWPFVYHCLRVNDLSIVQFELQACVDAGYHSGEQFVLVIVKTLLKISAFNNNTKKNNNRNLFNYNNNNNNNNNNEITAITTTAALNEQDLRVFLEAIQQCRSLYVRESSKLDENFDSVDPYRLVVLNLCGLVDKNGLANAPFSGFYLVLLLFIYFIFLFYLF
jgi:hypothetical protein